MTRTELFKLRVHRTPLVLLLVMVTSLLIAPIYFAIKQPNGTVDMLDAYVGVFTTIGPVLATVFGGWIVGHEFRQGTMRRVVGADARRSRLIGVKAVIGLGALSAALAIAGAIGAAASAMSAASFDATIVWDGVARDVLSGGFLAIAIATIAFGLSVLLRSDTYAMIGAIALISLLGPLLSLIPKIGKYVPSALANDVAAWIAGSDDLAVEIVPATFGLAASIGVLGAAAVVTFNRVDV